MGGSVKNAWDSTVGKATDKLWNEPTKGIRKTVKKAVGEHVYNLGSAVGSAIMGDFGGAITRAGSYLNQYNKIQEDDVVKAAYIAAGAIGALGAGGGLALGGGEAAGTAATTGATATGAATAGGAAGGLSSGTALSLGALGASTIYQGVQSKRMADQQAKAQARAEANALAAERESEILRKRALLASQKSMTARRATAGAIVNKLKNTTGYLGEDEEKLGG